jgi:hypothetical protein
MQASRIKYTIKLRFLLNLVITNYISKTKSTMLERRRSSSDSGDCLTILGVLLYYIIMERVVVKLSISGSEYLKILLLGRIWCGGGDTPTPVELAPATLELSAKFAAGNHRYGYVSFPKTPDSYSYSC